MSCNKCGKAKLCPVSFGLALGLTCFIMMALCTVWVVNYGPTEWMNMMHMPAFTMAWGMTHAAWCLLKGFVFGFVLALLYDLIACCIARCCCRKCDGCAAGCKCGPDCKCGAGCKCCSSDNASCGMKK